MTENRLIQAFYDQIRPTTPYTPSKDEKWAKLRHLRDDRASVYAIDFFKALPEHYRNLAFKEKLNKNIVCYAPKKVMLTNHIVNQTLKRQFVKEKLENL
jgi:hypothetical protein